MLISIVDYGMGNLRSVQKAFERVGVEARVIGSAEQIDAAEKLVLPGVGAFADAIATLDRLSMSEALRRYVARGRPFLGICLGLQLLFDRGLEDGDWAGLGILGGRCVRLEVDQTAGLKVPHMGWNTLEIRRPAPIYRDLPDRPACYFVHAYHVQPTDPSVVATTTDYGGDFVSSVWRDNLLATQFHPEKSQTVGLKILENFARL